jgi:uracil-DNA glycosylase
MKEDWARLLKAEREKDYYIRLMAFLDGAYESGAVYPPRRELFAALSLTGFAETRVVILGQDPYHGENQAHGLAFSVKDETAALPPSLRNIFKELESDLGVRRTRPDLTDWAKQGVLLLNTVLSVEKGKPGSHRKMGWERFTDEIIRLLGERAEPAAFLLWGKDAQKKLPLIAPCHHIICSAHPSPLSARNGFFGSRPFSRANARLKEAGYREIDWSAAL